MRRIKVKKEKEEMNEDLKSQATLKDIELN